MAGITLEQAQSMLEKYIEAEQAVLLGQEYELMNRRLRRANLVDIQAGIKLWSDRVAQLEAKANGTGRSVSMRANW